MLTKKLLQTFPNFICIEILIKHAKPLARISVRFLRSKSHATGKDITIKSRCLYTGESVKKEESTGRGREKKTRLRFLKFLTYEAQEGRGKSG